jgi:serine/threonine protein kinase
VDDDGREGRPPNGDSIDPFLKELARIPERPLEDTEPAPGREASIPEGTRLGRYIVGRLLGSGGMGVVYTAFDPELNRKIALKFLHPPANEADAARQRVRLLREAQAMAQLRHPNVVAVHDVGVLEDQQFVAMEFVEGSTLRRWLQERPRSWREIVATFALAGRGLFAAHRAGLVHRDFKPENVLIGQDGRVCVTDFGLARSYENESAARLRTDAPPEETATSAVATPVTVTGTLLGTPAYMSPEQHRGEEVDARADQYSFCVALHEALYGERPGARGASGRADSAVPTWVGEVISRGLRMNREERWPTMATLLGALEADPEARRRRRRRAAAVLAFSGAEPRMARRALARGDRARARELAEKVIRAWSTADVKVPAVDEMRRLLQKLGK